MKKVAFCITVGILVISIIIAIPLNTMVYSNVLNLLPNYVQSAYIGFVLKKDNSLFRTNYVKVSMLKVLTDKDFQYDANLLLPLCKRGNNSLVEPIPQIATNLIFSKHIKLIPKLMTQYKNDKDTIQILEQKYNAD